MKPTRDVRIHDLSASGEGIGRLDDGRVVFVPKTLPGDVVRVQLGEVRKRVQHAELVELLTPSAERVDGLCRVERCGGCALKGLSPGGQGHLKRAHVVEALRRVGGLDVESLAGPVVQVGDGWHYRHRIRTQAEWVDGHWQLGYFERRTRRLVPLIGCPVLWPEVEKAALGVAQVLRAAPHSAKLSEVELAYSRRDGRASASLVVEGSVDALRSLSAPLLEVVSGFEVQGAASKLRFGNLELRYDHQHAAEYDLRFEAGVFTQAHPAANDRLVDAVVGTVKPRAGQRVIEYHAGIGNFSLPIARAGSRVVAVERNRRAAVLCQRNARAAGAEVEVTAASDVEALAAVDHCELAVLDPPRTGARELVAHLAQSGPPRVVYVSCDAATLARDAATLARGGYSLKALDAFDLFPQTPHVEALALFER